MGVTKKKYHINLVGAGGGISKKAPKGGRKSGEAAPPRKKGR